MKELAFLAVVGLLLTFIIALVVAIIDVGGDQ